MQDRDTQALVEAARSVLRTFGVERDDYFEQNSLEELRSATRAFDTYKIPCKKCSGSGEETYYVTDPENCGNCAWGDCDYGHARTGSCSTCAGEGKVKL